MLILKLHDYDKSNIIQNKFPILIYVPKNSAQSVRPLDIAMSVLKGRQLIVSSCYHEYLRGDTKQVGSIPVVTL